MDVETQLNDLGVDAVVGIQMMNQLGITPYDIAEPSRFQRFQDVIRHFRDNPDREYLINRITIGKNVDRLDHVWGYAELQRQKAVQEREAIDLSYGLNTLDRTDADFVSRYNDSKERYVDSLSKARMIDEQIERYER